MQEQRLDEHRRIVCPGGGSRASRYTPASIGDVHATDSSSTPRGRRRQDRSKIRRGGKASRLEDRRTRGRGTAGEEETCAGEDDCAVVRDVLTCSAPALRPRSPPRRGEWGDDRTDAVRVVFRMTSYDDSLAPAGPASGGLALLDAQLIRPDAHDAQPLVVRGLASSLQVHAPRLYGSTLPLRAQ